MTATLRIIGFGILGAGVGGLTAFLFRWYSGSELPDGVAIILGLGVIAAWLNTTAVLGRAIGGTDIQLSIDAAVFTISSFGVGVVGTDIGRRFGDRLGKAITRIPHRDESLSTIIKTRGRLLTVSLPDEIGDLDGYEPIDPAQKAQLAGRSFVFPRRLTVDELRTRIVDRLVSDYRIGQVDVELTSDGTITHLAVGGQVTGLGSTLPPGRVAVAIRADPAFSAGPGDAVQIWTDDESPQLVARGELRGTTADLATVAVDRDVVAALDPASQYRLVTLPSQLGAGREFASLLRAATETTDAILIEPQSELVGQPLRDVRGSVVAIETADGTLTAVPSLDRTLSPGETLYVIGQNKTLRTLRSNATGP